MSAVFVHAAVVGGLVTLAWLVLRLRLSLRASFWTARVAWAALMLGPCAVIPLSEWLPAPASPLAIGSVTRAEPTSGALTEPPPSGGPASAPRLEPHASQAVTWLWGGGALACLSYLAWQLRRLRRHLRRLPLVSSDEADLLKGVEFPGATRFLADAGATGPYSTSLFGRCIVFPAGFAESLHRGPLAAVLRHERAHLRHRDACALLAWRLLAALCWWHPLAWRLPRMIEALQERRADAEAVDSPEEALEFSRLLLQVAEIPVFAHAVRPGNARLLKDRLVHLLGARPVRCPVRSRVLLGSCGLMGCLLIAGCASLLPRRIDSGASVVELDRRLQEVVEAALRDGRPFDGPILGLEVKFFTGLPKTPSTRILKAAAARREVLSLLADRRVTTVSYPRVVTVNDREVLIRNVVHRTIPTRNGAKEGTTDVDLGTTLRLKPVRQKDGRYRLEVDLALTDEIGSEVIGGKKYPVISTRKCHWQQELTPGEVVVIDGLADVKGRLLTMHLGLEVVGIVTERAPTR